MGQPAAGKTYLINNLSQNSDFDNLIMVDNFYNKKRFFKKAIFLLFRLGYLDSNYFRCKPIIKKALLDRKQYMRSFFLRQFRLDYILIKYAFKLSNKGYNCVFSENFYNLFSYIFFYNASKEKESLFFELASMLPKTILQRDFLVRIIVDAKNNLVFKSARAGKEQHQFVDETDFYNDYSRVNKAQLESLNHLKKYVHRIVYFENKYDVSSRIVFLNIFNNIINKK